MNTTPTRSTTQPPAPVRNTGRAPVGFEELSARPSCVEPGDAPTHTRRYDDGATFALFVRPGFGTFLRWREAEGAPTRWLELVRTTNTTRRETQL